MLNIFKSTKTKLEEAKLALESELEHCKMPHLIDNMSSKDVYSSLLNERRKTETRSTDSISWYAYRRAEKLSSEKDKSELLRLLSDPQYGSKKKHIYFALSHLCKNNTDISLFNFLMKKMEEEKSSKYKSVILLGIAKMNKQSKDLNLEPIKELTKTRLLDLRINSIIALQKTSDPHIEPMLLNIFQKTKDSHIKNMICTPLETIGTISCIPILEKAHQKTRDYGLRDSIEFTIDKIRKGTSSVKR